MRTLALNGSPRKCWNTAQLLESALSGAREAGSQTEMFHLFDYNYKGCISCFGCKRRNSKLCHCYFKDGLSPILEKILQTDILLLGSPIYFGDVTGQMRNLLERLGFITLTYDNPQQQIFPGRIDSAFFYTMNVPATLAKNYGYEALFQRQLLPLQRLGGNSQYYAAYNTLQFDDYSQYRCSYFNAAEKERSRQEDFPKDLEAAYQIGFQLVKERLALAAEEGTESN